ncbi:hypothetical protein [Aquabacterium sp. J223]|uniref:hypothetical protein n=1 Tax=Aquabacterium sp. J223 TaxID=2898431 RepID=UPI0021AE0DEB|nr:hypothetical protein [Aquabacterium sp. J223]UUX95403.1 hypothetical protein LRS07_19675 [Aquabacterium sp. J223]
MSAVVHAAGTDLGDAASGSDALGIPEPLVFDLVRPLGSPKGELEVNLYAAHGRGQGLAWSPELEYVFADGHAVELELPHSRGTLDEIKVAVQGTFGGLWGGRMIHGWQFISRKALEAQPTHHDLLYLHGARWSDQWSSMHMVGLRHAESAASGPRTWLVNAALFWRASDRWTLGLEANLEHARPGGWGYRLTPQLHLPLRRNEALQLGLGPSTLNHDRKRRWLLVARFSRNF